MYYTSFKGSIFNKSFFFPGIISGIPDIVCKLSYFVLLTDGTVLYTDGSVLFL